MRFIQWLNGPSKGSYGFVIERNGQYRFSHWPKNEWRNENLNTHSRNGNLADRYSFVLTVLY